LYFGPSLKISGHPDPPKPLLICPCFWCFAEVVVTYITSQIPHTQVK